MSDDSTIIELQDSCNRIFYETVTSTYAQLLEITDEKNAINILVAGISTNLGLILAQLPTEMQKEYTVISHQIIDKSISSTIKNISYLNYGQIGHA